MVLIFDNVTNSKIKLFDKVIFSNRSSIPSVEILMFWYHKSFFLFKVLNCHSMWVLPL